MYGAYGVLAALRRARPHRQVGTVVAHLAAGRPSSACTASSRPAGPWPARSAAPRATTTPRSPPTACSTAPTASCRSRWAAKGSGAVLRRLRPRPRHARTGDQRAARRRTATGSSSSSRACSPDWKAADLLARLDEIGVPAGQGPDHRRGVRLGADPQPGPARSTSSTPPSAGCSSPDRRCGSSTAGGQEVTRTAHTAPPTLDQRRRRRPRLARAGLRLTSRPRPRRLHRRPRRGRLPCSRSSSTATGGWSSRPTSCPSSTSRVIDAWTSWRQVIRRDFEAKAPSGTEILRRIEAGDHYRTRFELMRDVALNLFWTNRFAMTMYDKRPTRWRDVPRNRDDVFLPVLAPWQDAERKVAAVQDGLRRAAGRLGRRGRGPDLPGAVRRAARTGASTRPSCRPSSPRSPRSSPSRTASPTRWRPTTPTTRSTATSRSSTAPRTSPSWRRCTGGRWCCTTSTRGTARRPGSPRSASCATTTTSWSSTRATARSSTSSAGCTRDGAASAAPRLGHVARRSRPSRRSAPTRRSACGSGSPCCRSSRRWRWSRASGCAPTTTSSATPPTAGRRCRPQEITEKTGIESRVYTSRPLEDIALQAARAALRHAGRATRGDRRGAVLHVHQHAG